MPVGDGFSTSARHRIEAAIEHAQSLSGLTFSVSIGRSSGDSREHARRLLSQDFAHVVIFVSPDQRQLEIVTNAAARPRLTDELCALSSLSMTTSFSVGDLVGGIVTGLRMLGEGARPAVVV